MSTYTPKYHFYDVIHLRKCQEGTEEWRNFDKYWRKNFFFAILSSAALLRKLQKMQCCLVNRKRILQQFIRQLSLLFLSKLVSMVVLRRISGRNMLPYHEVASDFGGRILGKGVYEFCNTIPVRKCVRRMRPTKKCISCSLNRAPMDFWPAKKTHAGWRGTENGTCIKRYLTTKGANVP